MQSKYVLIGGIKDFFLQKSNPFIGYIFIQFGLERQFFYISISVKVKTRQLLINKYNSIASPTHYWLESVHICHARAV